jgi:predicted DNA-binding transcriptional regulator AlpA
MNDDFSADEDQTINADDFMRLLKISPNTFAKLLRDGTLPRPLPLGLRIRRWSRQAVMYFLNNSFNPKITLNTKI